MQASCGSDKASYEMDTGVCFIEGNVTGVELTSSGAEVKNPWSFASSPSCCMMFEQGTDVKITAFREVVPYSLVNVD
jgi:hypothetical protein